MTFGRLLMVLLSLIPVQACSGEVSPIATANISGGWECQVDGVEDPTFRLRVCGYVDDDVFVVYDTLDDETFRRKAGVATGKIPYVLDEENAEPVKFSVLLYPATIIGAAGGWNGRNFGIGVQLADGRGGVFFFVPPGQPDVFGVPIRFEEVPDVAKTKLPSGAEAGYYGTVPSTGEHLLIYKVPRPQEPPKDEVDELINILYPPLSGDMGVMMGAKDLKEIKVTDIYSYGGGAQTYVETTRGVFFFPRRDAPIALFGRIAHRYHVP